MEEVEDPHEANSPSQSHLTLIHSPKKRVSHLLNPFTEDEELSKKIRLTLSEGDNYLHHYARANFNQEISQLLSNLSKEESHYLETLLEGNADGNTPAMVAAKYNHKEALLALLTPMISEETSVQSRFLHHKNSDEHNIMFLVAHHPGSLFVSWSILMDLEKSVHDSNSLDTQLCLKGHLGTSLAAQSSLQLLSALQREENLRAKTTFLQSLGSIFILKMVFYFLDVATDAILLSEYYHGWSKDELKKNAVLFPGQDPCKDHYFLSNYTGKVELECYASKLTNKSMFCMTLSIILLPPFLFIFETLHFGLLNDWARSINTPWTRRILKTFGNILLWMFWPVAVFFRHFWYLYKYSMNHGDKRISTYGPALKEARFIGSRTQLIEVCTEASLQPLIQVYLIFITIVNWGNSLSTEILENKTDRSIFSVLTSSILTLTPKQVLCVFVSILTLSLSFTAHYRSKKDNVVGVLPSFVYFLSTLCSVIARILSFQMFAYYLGPGNFGLAFIGILCHITLFSGLHFVFSNSLAHVENYGCIQKGFIVLYDCFINGMANLYVHNHIEVFYNNAGLKKQSSNDEPHSTLLRQSIFDVIFIGENLAMILSARYTLQKSFEEVYDTMALVIAGLCATGILLKITFYSCCHIWSDIIVRRKNKQSLRLGGNVMHFLKF